MNVDEIIEANVPFSESPVPSIYLKYIVLNKKRNHYYFEIPILNNEKET
jgi:hypothetical protein